jgi:hypothetical protein
MITNKKQQLLSFSSNPKLIAKLCLNVVHQLQDEKPGDIIVSLALLMLVVTEAFDCKPEDTLPIANSIRERTFKNQYNHEYNALKEYVTHEFTNR